MILIFLISFIMGMLLGPIIGMWICHNVPIPNKNKKSVRIVRVPTIMQNKMLLNSTHICTDLNWFNIFLQRYFLECTNSYAYKDKIKRTMLARFVKVERFVKTEITDINFGVEAPVITSIRVATDGMIDDLIKNSVNFKKSLKNLKKNDFQDQKVEGEIQKDIQDDLNNMIDHIVDDYGNKEYEKNDEPAKSNTNDKHVGFSIITYIMDLEYNGTLVIESLCTLPKKYKIPIKLNLNRLKGKALVRVPAIYTHDKYEITFVSIEDLDYNVQSEPNNNYLRKSLDNIGKLVFLMVFEKTLYFPNFKPQNLPNLRPSSKQIDFHAINVKSCEDASSVLNSIRLLMCLGFKTYKNEKGIISGKSKIYNKNRRRVIIKQLEIIEIVRRLQRITENNKNDVKDESEQKQPLYTNSKKIVDDDLSNSLIRLFVSELEIFKKTINAFDKIKIISKNENYDKIELVFFTKTYNFTRIFSDNVVIFISDDTDEFFSFSIRNLTYLEIYSYVYTKDFTITDNRAIKFYKKIYGKNYKSFKSIFAKNYKKKKDANKEMESINEIEMENIEKSFQLIDEFRDRIINGDINFYILKKKIMRRNSKMNVDKGILLKFIQDNHSVRFKLYSMHFSSNKIAIHEYMEYGLNENSGKMIKVISSFYEKLVVDLFDSNEFICLEVNENSENNINQSNLTIHYSFDIDPEKFHSFICTLKIFELICRYDTALPVLEFKKLDEKQYKNTFSVENCSIYIEITTKYGDEIYFSLYNKTTRFYEIPKMKLVCNLDQKAHRFIISMPEKCALQINIKACDNQKLSQILKLKINQNPELKYETLYDCITQISSKSKMKFKLWGYNSQSSFWDFENNGEYEAKFVQNYKEVVCKPTNFGHIQEGKGKFIFTSKKKQKDAFSIICGCTSMKLD